MSVFGRALPRNAAVRIDAHLLAPVFITVFVGLAYMLEGVGQLFGNLAAGGRLGSHSPRSTFAIGSTLMGIGAITIYTLQPGALITVAIAMSIAFIAGVTFTNLTTLLAQETPSGAATTMVLNISTIGFGGAIGSAAGGLLIGIGGYPLIGVAALVLKPQRDEAAKQAMG